MTDKETPTITTAGIYPVTIKWAGMKDSPTGKEYFNCLCVCDKPEGKTWIKLWNTPNAQKRLEITCETLGIKYPPTIETLKGTQCNLVLNINTAGYVDCDAIQPYNPQEVTIAEPDEEYTPPMERLETRADLAHRKETETDVPF